MLPLLEFDILAATQREKKLILKESAMYSVNNLKFILKQTFLIIFIN